jgi:hypothetical protein
MAYIISLMSMYRVMLRQPTKPVIWAAVPQKAILYMVFVYCKDTEKFMQVECFPGAKGSSPTKKRQAPLWSLAFFLRQRCGAVARRARPQ